MMLQKLTNALLRHTLRTKREASEECMFFSAFNSLVNEQLKAKRYSWPYAHVVIDGFLKPEAARAASLHFDTLVTNREKHFLKRDLYEVYGHNIRTDEHPSLSFLFDLNFKTELENIFGLSLTEHVRPVMHNNVPRTEDKYVHTDWSLAFFLPHAPCGQLVNSVPDHLITNIVGNAPTPEGSVIERRALTAILYLSPDWEPGKGGETGIFAKIGERYIETARIEPRFNRLLLFENTPRSFHNYMASSLPNRNSIIEWFHTRTEN